MLFLSDAITCTPKHPIQYNDVIETIAYSKPAIGNLCAYESPGNFVGNADFGSSRSRMGSNTLHF